MQLPSKNDKYWEAVGHRDVEALFFFDNDYEAVL